MNRRQFIGSATVASFTATASFAHAHDHADHVYHIGHVGHAHPAPCAYETARKAAVHYVEADRICLAHCTALLSEGDISMEDCAAGINQMLAPYSTLQNLAAQNLRLTPSLAKVRIEAYKQCSAVRKRHTGHYAECRICYESYLVCIKECEKIAA